MSDSSLPAWRRWLIALQPYSSPVSIAPVLLGTGLAVHYEVFAPVPAVFALLGALAIQHGADLTNVYYDYRSGVDTDASHDASGEKSVIHRGLLEAEQVFHGALLLFGLAFVIGIYLVWLGGVPVLLAGVASIVAGYLYSGGPYPYGHYALGDVFAFTFFGVVAVTGTYYVQAVVAMGVRFPIEIPEGALPMAVVVGSLPMAGLIAGLLVINNIRDIETDAAAGKRTVANVVGVRWSRVEYLGLLGLAFAVPGWFALRTDAGWQVLLAWITVPLAGANLSAVFEHRSGDALNPALARQVKLTASFAVLFAIGLVL